MCTGPFGAAGVPSGHIIVGIDGYSMLNASHADVVEVGDPGCPTGCLSVIRVEKEPHCTIKNRVWVRDFATSAHSVLRITWRKYTSFTTGCGLQLRAQMRVGWYSP